MQCTMYSELTDELSTTRVGVGCDLIYAGVLFLNPFAVLCSNSAENFREVTHFSYTRGMLAEKNLELYQ